MLFRSHRKSVSRLLVVEDEPLIAFDNEYFLQEEGYEVVATVDTAAAALSLLETEQVDAVLLDVNLAGETTGIDVAQKARDIGVPVLFLSGSIPEQAADLAMAAVAKPYSNRDLGAALKAIEAILAGREIPAIPSSVRLFA